MNGTWLAVVLVAATAIAGCSDPEETEDPGPWSFDGQGAYAVVEGLVTDGQGQPRPRVPGTPEHAAAADWLQQQMSMDGWAVTRQSFNGTDYQEARKVDGLGVYSEPGPHCHVRDQQRLPDLVFHNLVAFHDTPDDREVLLAAHWESKENSSDGAQGPVLGANDGASGVGVLVQLMRHVSEGDVSFPFDLRIVLFDGEDGFEDCHPLAGSTYYAGTMDQAPARMLLLDMVGDPAARFVRERHSVTADPVFVDLFWEHGARNGLADNLAETQREVWDDHRPFIDRGVRAIDIIDFGRDGTGFPPYWHTTGDTMANIDAQMLADVGATVAATLTDDRFAQSL